MNRQELLTSIQLTDAELDRLLRKMGQTDLIGINYIPEDIATKIVENYNRYQQQTTSPPSLPAGETPVKEDDDDDDEYFQAIQETANAANQALTLAANAGATTGEQFVETFAKAFTTSAVRGMGKFQQQLQQQMTAITITSHNAVATLVESPKTLEAQAK